MPEQEFQGTDSMLFFRQWVLHVPKYRLAPDHKVETACTRGRARAVPELFCDYLEK